MADEDLKEMMQENLEISRETLKILKKIHRARIVSGFFSLLKWIFIIGTSIGAYYYLEPFLTATLNNLQSLMSGMEQVRGAGKAVSEIPNISPHLLEQVKNILP